MKYGVQNRLSNHFHNIFFDVWMCADFIYINENIQSFTYLCYIYWAICLFIYLLFYLFRIVVSLIFHANWLILVDFDLRMTLIYLLQIISADIGV